MIKRTYDEMTKNNQNFSWDQLWVGKWGLQFTSIDGVLYTKNIKELIEKLGYSMTLKDEKYDLYEREIIIISRCDVYCNTHQRFNTCNNIS